MGSLLRDRLRKELETDLEQGKLVWNDLGTVNRVVYARRLGVTRKALPLDLLAEFDAKGPQVVSTADRLRTLLDADLQRGALVSAHPGVLNRRHYVRAIGCGHPNGHRLLFEHYEKQLEQRPVRERLSALLEKDRANRTLKFRSNGKLDRLHYATELGVGGKLDRYLPVFEQYEIEEGGWPVSFEVDLDEMEAWLEAERRTRSFFYKGRVSRQRFRKSFQIPFPDFERRHPGIRDLLHRYDLDAVGDGTIADVDDQGLGDLDTAADREPEKSLGATASVVIERYPSLEKHQHYSGVNLSRNLVAALNELLIANQLPRSRGGKISRKHFGTLFGVEKSAMTRYVGIFKDYEAATGGTVPEWEAKCPEIRVWLSTRLLNGTIELQHGRLSRLQLADAFPGIIPVYHRYPGLAALIAEFDEKIVATGYVPGRLNAEVEAVRSSLEGDFPLYRTGLSYSRKELAAATGVSTIRLARPPFISVILAAERELRKRVDGDGLTCVLQGRRRSFRELLDIGWSDAFMARVVKAFSKTFHSAKEETTKGAFVELLGFLRYLGTSDDSSCMSVKAALNAGGVRMVRMSDWAFAQHSFQASINNNQAYKGRTGNTKLTIVNSVIRALANLGALPESEVGMKGDRSRSEHRRTIAQGHKSEGVDDYLTFATSMLREAAKSQGLVVEPSEEAGFLRTLRQELEQQQPRDKDTPATIILRVLKRRLALIEAAAANIHQKWHRHWEHGQKLLDLGESIGGDWMERLISENGNDPARKEEMRRCFPIDDRQRATSNLVRLIADHFPSMKVLADGVGYGQFFSRRMRELGGMSFIEGYLVPPAEAVAASVISYLCEAGTNVAVARTLYTVAIEPSEITGCVRITGEKARAGGKPIHAHLDGKGAAVTSMKWLMEASARLRNLLGPDDGQLLFVANVQSRTKPIEEYFIRSTFKKMVEDIPELAGLGLTPALIRPTVLLIASLEGGASAHISALLGQHGLNVNQGYSDQPPTRFMRDMDILGSLEGMETLVILNEKDAQAFVGVSAEQMEERAEKVMETGLGTFCRDRYARPGNDGKICTQFDCWNNCPSLLVIARKREFAFMIIWRKSLLEVEGDWIRDRPERWFTQWDQWLALIETVEKKVKFTSMGKIWREAEVAASAVISHKNFRPWRPF
ncbi:hypothetical protein [Rhizobium leguminosarum]|uniref:hypothetical protein n=1 Tax=Rhizobium leguminosarum TaxID=384 RepID=UPI001442132D|nr:hypothetical protein [Rhizobium leguminosarum]NKL92807.1 hypothetical protein [Rhizobium leguminosarum bv. viciae]